MFGGEGDTKVFPFLKTGTCCCLSVRGSGGGTEGTQFAQDENGGK